MSSSFAEKAGGKRKNEDGGEEAAREAACAAGSRAGDSGSAEEGEAGLFGRFLFPDGFQGVADGGEGSAQGVRIGSVVCQEHGLAPAVGGGHLAHGQGGADRVVDVRLAHPAGHAVDGEHGPDHFAAPSPCARWQQPLMGQEAQCAPQLFLPFRFSFSDMPLFFPAKAC